MSNAALLLAGWFTPAVWLSIPAMIVERGPEGLWVGLALFVLPLVALGIGPSRSDASAPDAVFPVAVLLFSVGMLFWANMSLAGDVTAWLGWPRWYGIVGAAVGGWLLTWPGAKRLAPALLLVAALAVSLPLVELARASGMGPIRAWTRVASQTAFRFPSTSPWVTDGRDLGTTYGRAPIRFDEEHRVTAAGGGRLYVRAADGTRVDDLEWTLAPGQSVTFRPGDRIQRSSTARLRFEPDKRVPGAPTSGMSWAAGRGIDWPRAVGLVVTVLFGALALCRTAAPAAASRTTVTLVTGGGLLVFLWAQGWAVYSLLASPDLFLGSVTPERLLTMPALGGDDPARRLFQPLLLAGGLAGFFASSIALRERLGALDRTGGGEIGHDLGLWAGVFAIAGLAGLWHFDSWALVLLALGVAASAVSPGSFGARASPVAATVAGVIGLAVFVALAVTEQVRGGAEGWLGAILAYPALAAVPAAALVLWISTALVAD